MAVFAQERRFPAIDACRISQSRCDGRAGFVASATVGPDRAAVSGARVQIWGQQVRDSLILDWQFVLVYFCSTKVDYREPDWVAERLGVEKNTVYRFLHDGVIPAIQLGRKWLVSEQRLQQWLAEETDRQTRARREAVQSRTRVAQRWENLTGSARAAVKRAHGEARQYSHERLDAIHLLLALALDRETSAGAALRELGVTAQKIRNVMEAKIARGAEPPARRLSRTPEAKKAMRLATRLALREADGEAIAPVGSDHLLMGILLARRGLGHEILASAGITRQRLREALRDADKNSHSKRRSS